MANQKQATDQKAPDSGAERLYHIIGIDRHATGSPVPAVAHSERQQHNDTSFNATQRAL